MLIPLFKYTIWPTGNKVLSPFLTNQYSTAQYNLSSEVSTLLKDLILFEDFYSNADISYIRQQMKTENLRYINSTYSIVYVYQSMYSVAVDIEEERILEYDLGVYNNNKSPQNRVAKHQKTLARKMNSGI